MYTIIIIIGVSIIISLIVLLNNQNTINDKTNIKKLLRQTARWSVASHQDSNPYIANLHATYSLGYLMALREIYTDEIIMKLTNVDIRRLESEVTMIMDNAVKKLIQICPEGQPKNRYLAYLSKQGN